MKKCCILSCLVAAVLASCSAASSVRKVLDDAEELMPERPDSALYLLQGIGAEDFVGNRKLKAEYSLLLSMAFDKNYMDLTSDSLINVAVDYYGRGRDYERRFRSLYYQGRIYENRKDYGKAMLSFTEAEQLVDKVQDDFYKGLLYAHIANLYDDFYNLLNFNCQCNTGESQS